MRALGFGKKIAQSEIFNSEVTNKIVAPTWRQTLQKPAPEFPLTNLSLTSGSIPKGLRGTFYRNGPGRLSRGDHTAKHWVDGDGAVLAVHFNEGKASGTYKYIRSKHFEAEEAANKLIYAGFGTTMNLPFWKRPLIQDIKNAGNVSVLPLKDKLLAMWDGGLPYGLDSETLETHGVDKLGFLSERETFSAHPKVDPVTGEIFNFGFKTGKNMELALYKLDSAGNLLKKNSIPFRFNLIHDCVIAGKYLIVMNFPTKVTSLASVLFGLKSIKDVVQWDPDQGTEVFIFDRNDLSLVKSFKTDPFYSCHFTNGFEEKDGNVYIELVTYKNYHAFDDYVSAVPNLDKPLPPGLTARLGYMRIDPKQGKLIEMKHLSGEGVEFPNVVDHKVGKKWQYTYLSTGSTQNAHIVDDQFGAICRYDYKNQDFVKFEYGKDKYVTEPTLIDQGEDSEEAYIMSQVYDAAADKSEIWIHDSKTFEKEPLCRLELPSNVPLGFHGKWQSRE